MTRRDRAVGTTTSEVSGTPVAFLRAADAFPAATLMSRPLPTLQSARGVRRGSKRSSDTQDDDSPTATDSSAPATKKKKRVVRKRLPKFRRRDQAAASPPPRLAPGHVDASQVIRHLRDMLHTDSSATTDSPNGMCASSAYESAVEEHTGIGSSSVLMSRGRRRSRRGQQSTMMRWTFLVCPRGCGDHVVGSDQVDRRRCLRMEAVS